MYAELMLPPHAFMHGVTQRNRRFFSGLYSRRTDDGTWRSAPFHQLDARFTQDRQRLIAHIAHLEHTFNWLLKAHRTMIDAGLVKLGAWGTCNFWFERSTAAAGHCGHDSEYNHNSTDNNCREQPRGSLELLRMLWLFRFTQWILL
jgi:hypothetical protein